MTPPAAARPTRIYLAAGAIVLAGVVAYHDSLGGPFLFDDPSSILANPSIRSLWPPWAAFAPPNAAITVQGRPVLNFSFALNYAIGGPQVWSYHVLNLVIHVCAGLALFGVARRTLIRTRLAADALPIALAIAALWTVHPLQTESVSYVVQRAESLMGFFFLLTFYAFIRSAENGGRGWGALAAAACVLGAATKEVMVMAPPLVLLYDRVFVAGSFREAWRRHGRLHAALFATWLVIVALVLGTGGNRGGSVGPGTGIAWWAYPLTQVEAVARYLGLAVWPHPLVFEYGTFWVTRAAGLWPWVLPVAGALAATLLAWRRAPALGFLGCWFFAILAPTSLAPGTTQMIVEHRMYLPLAAVIAAIVLALHVWLRARSAPVFAALTVVLAVVTVRRNDDYRDEAELWRTAVVHRPANPLAHQMLAMALEKSGDRAGARVHYEAALALKPNFAFAHDGLGQVLYRDGEKLAAAGHFETALRLQPDFADAHDHLAMTLAGLGRPAEALAHATAAVRTRPDFPEAQLHLANLLADAGRTDEAIAHYEATLRLRPAQPTAHYNLGNALASSGRPAEAVAHYEAAVRLKPDYADAFNNLGAALLALGRRDEAIARFEEALRLNPGFSDTRAALAQLRAEASARR